MMALATAGILSFSTKPLRMGIFVGLTASRSSASSYGVSPLVSYFIDRSPADRLRHDR